MLTYKKLLAFLNWLWFPEQGNPWLLLPELKQFWQPRESRCLQRSRSPKGVIKISPLTVWQAVNFINSIVISFEISQSLITNQRRTKGAKAGKSERQSGFQMTVEKINNYILQSNHSDQSQRWQAAQWTNHCQQLLVTCSKRGKKSHVQGVINFGFASN